MRIISIITAFLLFSMLSGGSARAACVFDGRSHWEIGDYLYLEQSNHFHVQITAYRDPANPNIFSGQAQSSGWFNITPGSVSGFTFRVQFQIYWFGGETGEYRGQIADNGMVYWGETHDLRNPPTTASWYSTLPMWCRPDNPPRESRRRAPVRREPGSRRRTRAFAGTF